MKLLTPDGKSITEHRITEHSMQKLQYQVSYTLKNPNNKNNFYMSMTDFKKIIESTEPDINIICNWMKNK